MRRHSTRYTEHDLAVWFEVAPVFIVSWIEATILEARRDELGYVITNLEAAQFEDQRSDLIDDARRVSATTKGFGVARATLKRADVKRRAAEGEDDGA